MPDLIHPLSRHISPSNLGLDRLTEVLHTLIIEGSFFSHEKLLIKPVCSYTHVRFLDSDRSVLIPSEIIIICTFPLKKLYLFPVYGEN